MSLTQDQIIKEAYKLTQGSPEYETGYQLSNNISQEDKGKIEHFSHLLLLIQSQEDLPSSDEFIQSIPTPQQAGRRSRRNKRRRRKTRRYR